MANKAKQIKHFLKDYYTAPMESTFQKFRAGVIYFAVGLIIIYLANNTLPDSLKRDIVALFGLIMVAIGFFMAMMAQTRMVLSRIIRFFID